MSATIASAVSESGLVAYYPFDGDTRDYSGNGNDGTNNGATFVSGMSGNALDFDGMADYVSAPININSDVMPQVTMTLWVKSDSDSRGTVISHDNGGYDRTIDIDARGGGLGWSAFSGSGGVLGYQSVITDKWTFLAVVYDQDAGTVKFYVDGTMYEEEGSLGTGWNAINIGSNPSYGANFDGIIDEVRIYNYALTQSEINSIYEGGIEPSTGDITSTPTGPSISEPGLVAYYPFDKDTMDYSGNGNDGTNNGATFVSGIGGNALDFDGMEDYVSVPININPDVMPQATIALWVRSNSDSRGTVISHDNGGYDRTIDIDARGGGLGWSAFSGSGSVLGYQTVTTDKWTFLAVVYDQDAGTVKFYVDDVMYEEEGSLGMGWDAINIGSNPSFGAYFDGLIDEVRIYDYALTQSEISSLYGGEMVPPAGDSIPPSTVDITPPSTIEVSGLIFESRSKSSGSSVQIPLTLKGTYENIGNMDMSLSYDPSVLEATEVIKGGLTTNSLFDYNILDGTIKISLADKNGFGGDGSIAYVNFNIIGSEGSSSDLEITTISANRDDDEIVEIQTHDGLFNVVGMDESIGDADGDGVHTALDALYALQMSVGKIPEDLAMDVNGDGSVTSFDARRILKNVVGDE
ncbi:LamG-like jellyroll fold domain-containing protein [Methanolobus sp. ZRKC5]|uniref:LamG-like jellyroll fold domain-containing protein n=1 Tax=unclassified Methanolobus TaxID=2629569 RepID=UPI00313E121F